MPVLQGGMNGSGQTYSVEQKQGKEHTPQKGDGALSGQALSDYQAAQAKAMQGYGVRQMGSNVSQLGGGFGGFGGFGGGLGSLAGLGGFGASSAGSSYQPGNFTSNVQENPQLAALRGEMSKYQQGLGDGSDIDARNAMGRQRDIASGYAKEGMNQALDAGFGSDSGVAQKFRKSGIESGQMASAGLNSALTSDARSKQLQALTGRVGLESTQAGITQGQQNYALNAWQANQQAQQAAAQLQAVQQQNQMQNQLALLQASKSMYSGF